MHALADRHRPLTIDDVLGNDTQRALIKQVVRRSQAAHIIFPPVIVLAGPHGVGKSALSATFDALLPGWSFHRVAELDLTTLELAPNGVTYVVEAERLEDVSWAIRSAGLALTLSLPDPQLLAECLRRVALLEGVTLAPQVAGYLARVGVSVRGGFDALETLLLAPEPSVETAQALWPAPAFGETFLRSLGAVEFGRAAVFIREAFRVQGSSRPLVASIMQALHDAADGRVALTWQLTPPRFIRLTQLVWDAYQLDVAESVPVEALWTLASTVVGAPVRVTAPYVQAPRSVAEPESEAAILSALAVG